MDTKYLIGVLGLFFLALGCVGTIRNKGTLKQGSRTWLLVGVVFTTVSLWLFMQS